MSKSFDQVPREFKALDILKAEDVDAIVAEVRRLRNLTAAPPLVITDTGSGLVVSLQQARQDWKLFQIYDTYLGRGFYYAHPVKMPADDIDPESDIALATLGTVDTSISVCVANAWELSEAIGKMTLVWARFWKRNSDGLDIYLTQAAELRLCGS